MSGKAFGLLWEKKVMFLSPPEKVLGFHCLQKYRFRVFRLQRVKIKTTS